MREFILYSRKGWTRGGFGSLREAGRLDTVYQCALTAIFLSHKLRKDVKFHTILNGPPDPPGHLLVDGGTLHDVRVDELTWEAILNKVLSGGQHPGFHYEKKAYQKVVSDLHEDGASIFVLEERGPAIEEQDFSGHDVFILGDHVGLPRAEEKYALRYGKKISLGSTRYLALSVVDIINHHLDRKGL